MTGSQAAAADIRVEKPFPAEAAPRVWHWIQEFRWRVADDFGPTTIEEFVRQWDAAARTRETWGVWRGGELGGLVSVERVTPVLASTHCLFKKSFWGHAVTRTALAAVYAEVFAAGVEKVASVVFADNAQLLHLARSLGAVKEGILRRHTRRGGRMADMMAIGLLKEDFLRACGGSAEAEGGAECQRRQ